MVYRGSSRPSCKAQSAHQPRVSDPGMIRRRATMSLRFHSRNTITTFLKQQIRHNASSAGASTVTNVKTIPAPHSGSIRILSLNRPQARNAISKQLLRELTRNVNAIHEEGGKGPTRILILASDVDSAFCAGADLKERAGFSQQEYSFRPKVS